MPLHTPAPWPAYAALLGLVTVVYGSLLPFDWRPAPPQGAWRALLEAPWLPLGPGSRADWVANILLYIPLAFFGSAWLAGAAPRLSAGLRAITVLLFCVVTALAVEYAQVYVAPRTVSRNDLLAELLGSLAGAGLWLAAGGRVQALASGWAQGGRYAWQAAAVLYGLAYVAVALFPFDFVNSRGELAARLASVHTLLQPCGGLRCLLKLAAEVAITVPLGLLIAARLPAPRLLSGAVAGAALGLALEAAQVLLASGVVQGASVITRALGVACGAALYAHFPWSAVGRWRGALRPLILLALPAYALLLAWAGGWHGEKMALDAALGELKPAAFLPFYFHYFSSESGAVISLLRNAALYAPIGLAWAGWWWAGGGRGGAPVAPAAASGGLSALVVELGHLLSPVKHADPTNLLIAAAVAAGTCAVIAWLARDAARVDGAERAESHVGEPVAAAEPRTLPAASPLFRLAQRGLALIAAATAAAAAWHFPAHGPWVLLGLTLYGALLWRHPAAWLFVVPAALPMANLSVTSGWLLIDEFDLLILATFAVGLWRAPVALRSIGTMGLPLAILGILTVTYAVGMVKGVWGGAFQPPDVNALYSYHTPYNALRVGKVWLWAVALALLLLQRADLAADVHRRFLPGVVTGLILFSLAVVWERRLFSGVLNFAGDFRATGGLAAMHVGGPYIEVYLVLAIPLALWAVLSRGNPWWRLAGACATVLGGYALAVTYSRGGYLGFAVAIGTAAALWLLGGRGRPGFSTHLIAAAAALMLAAMAVVPILGGGYAQSRMAQIAPDLAERAAGWRADWQGLSKRPMDLLFGAGLGTYPSTFLLRHADDRRAPGTFRYVIEDGEAYVRLGGGVPVYLGQRVDVSGGPGYRLELRVRSDTAAGLSVPLCEKSLLYSSRCAWTHLSVPGDGQWHVLVAEVDARDVGTQINGVRRPVELALFNAARGTLIDVDRLSLKKDGRELLHNNEFTRAGARWFFNTDAHDAWHPRSLALDILVGQGVVGLAALGALLIVVLGRQLRGRLGEIGPAALGGAAGAFAIGIFDGWWDAPRLVLLLYVMVLLALASGPCPEAAKAPWLQRDDAAG